MSPPPATGATGAPGAIGDRGILLRWGALLRLSMSPSAAADAAAGVLLGAGTWPAGPAPFLLVAGSLCVYHGGMALNDWADRGHDARTRPEALTRATAMAGFPSTVQD